MSKLKRYKRLERINRYRGIMEKFAAPCWNCGERGHHFVAPCFGEPGFYSCEKKDSK